MYPLNLFQPVTGVTHHNRITIWTDKPTPALRTYLTLNDLKGKRIAFFICSGTEGYNQVFPLLKELTPEAENIITLGITQSQFKEDTYGPDLDKLVKKMK